jgi:hypothetical protein
MWHAVPLLEVGVNVWAGEEAGKLAFLSSKKEQSINYSPGTEKECGYGENHWQPSEMGEGVLGGEND